MFSESITECAGLQIIFFAKKSHHFDRTKQKWGRHGSICEPAYLMLCQRRTLVRTFCATTVRISSDICKFWSTVVRCPTVICSPECAILENIHTHLLQKGGGEGEGVFKRKCEANLYFVLLLDLLVKEWSRINLLRYSVLLLLTL